MSGNQQTESNELMLEPEPPSAPPPPLRVRRTFGGFIAENNPFYLISAACMLFGLLLLTNTTTWSPIALRRLLVLLVTVNVYELALLLLGLLLAVRGIARDARMLLVLQLVFLVDVAFLNAEVVNTRPNVGLLINCVLYVLALAKLAAICRVLNLRITPGEAIQCIVQITALFALPVVVHSLKQTPMLFYAIWWFLGLLPALYELLGKVAGARPIPGRGNAIPIWLYLMVPWLSLALHIGILHYVYDVRWWSPMLAPVLLGLAMVIRRATPTRFASRGELLFFSIALPLAAVVISRGNPAPLCFTLAGHKIGPFLLSSAAAYLLYVYWFFAAYAIWFLIAGVALAAWYLYGPTAEKVGSTLARAAEWLWNRIDAMIPRTAAGWGFIGLVAAFVFLGIGAAVSLRRAPTKEQADGREL